MYAIFLVLVYGEYGRCGQYIAQNSHSHGIVDGQGKTTTKKIVQNREKQMVWWYRKQPQQQKLPEPKSSIERICVWVHYRLFEFKQLISQSILWSHGAYAATWKIIECKTQKPMLIKFNWFWFCEMHSLFPRIVCCAQWWLHWSSPPWKHNRMLCINIWTMDAFKPYQMGSNELETIK